MTESRTIEVPGGWGHEGVNFVIGVNSGAGGIGFGVSDQQHAIMTGARQTTSLRLSMTPEHAEEVAHALLEHAASVREQLARSEAVDLTGIFPALGEIFGSRKDKEDG